MLHHHTPHTHRINVCPSTAAVVSSMNSCCCIINHSSNRKSNLFGWICSILFFIAVILSTLTSNTQQQSLYDVTTTLHSSLSSSSFIHSLSISSLSLSSFPSSFTLSLPLPSFILPVSAAPLTPSTNTLLSTLRTSSCDGIILKSNTMIQNYTISCFSSGLRLWVAPVTNTSNLSLNVQDGEGYQTLPSFLSSTTTHSGDFILKSGINFIQIKVIADDLVELIYNFYFVLVAPEDPRFDSTMKAIELRVGPGSQLITLTPVFKAGVLEYTTRTPPLSNTLFMRASFNYTGAKGVATIGSLPPVPVGSDLWSPRADLIPIATITTGDTLLTLVITSYSNSSTTTYKITITNPSVPVITLSKPLPLQVSVKMNEDACISKNPCLNGATCISTYLDASNAMVSCGCSAGFFGTTCENGIVGCANCIGNYFGGNSIQLYLRGENLNQLQTVMIGGAAVSKLNLTQLMVPILIQDTLVSHFLTFTLPALPIPTGGSISVGRRLLASMTRPSYFPLTFTMGNSISLIESTVLTQFNFTGLVFVSLTNCFRPGQFKLDIPSSKCTECPDGGVCPGGERVWPIAGWWSVNEFSKPAPCPIPDTCPGTDPRVAQGMVQNMEAVTVGTGERPTFKNTQVCAAGYAGTFCVNCAPDFFRVNGRCYSCPPLAQRQTQLLALIIGAGICVLVLSGLVAFLSANKLAIFTTAFVVLQRIAVVGSTGSRDLITMAESVNSLFSYMNLMNFNVEIFHPGCALPQLTWLMQFWGTITLILITYIFFLLFTVLRWRINVRREEKIIMTEDTVTAWEDFKRRVAHVSLIAGTIFYLKVVILQVAAFRCITVSAPATIFENLELDEPISHNFMVADYQTRCFQGNHTLTFIFVIATILFFTIGFPMMCFTMLRNAFGPVVELRRQSVAADVTSKPQLTRKVGRKVFRATQHNVNQSQYRMERFGYLWTGIKDECYNFKLNHFIVNIWFALVISIWVHDVPIQLFLMGLGSIYQCGLSIWMMPFKMPVHNFAMIGTYLFTLGYTIILSLVQPSTEISTFNILGLVGLLIGLAALLILLPLRNTLRKCFAPDIAEAIPYDPNNAPPPPRKKKNKKAAKVLGFESDILSASESNGGGGGGGDDSNYKPASITDAPEAGPSNSSQPHQGRVYSIDEGAEDEDEDDMPMAGSNELADAAAAAMHAEHRQSDTPPHNNLYSPSFASTNYANSTPLSPSNMGTFNLSSPSAASSAASASLDYPELGIGNGSPTKKSSSRKNKNFMRDHSAGSIIRSEQPTYQQQSLPPPQFQPETQYEHNWQNNVVQQYQAKQNRFSVQQGNTPAAVLSRFKALSAGTNGSVSKAAMAIAAMKARNMSVRGAQPTPIASRVSMAARSSVNNAQRPTIILR